MKLTKLIIIKYRNYIEGLPEDINIANNGVRDISGIVLGHSRKNNGNIKLNIPKIIY